MAVNTVRPKKNGIPKSKLFANGNGGVTSVGFTPSPGATFDEPDTSSGLYRVNAPLAVAPLVAVRSGDSNVGMAGQ